VVTDRCRHGTQDGFHGGFHRDQHREPTTPHLPRTTDPSSCRPQPHPEHRALCDECLRSRHGPASDTSLDLQHQPGQRGEVATGTRLTRTSFHTAAKTGLTTQLESHQKKNSSRHQTDAHSAESHTDIGRCRDDVHSEDACRRVDWPSAIGSWLGHVLRVGVTARHGLPVLLLLLLLLYCRCADRVCRGWRRCRIRGWRRGQG
jgi:hypothetical protein